MGNRQWSPYLRCSSRIRDPHPWPRTRRRALERTAHRDAFDPALIPHDIEKRWVTTQIDPEPKHQVRAGFLASAAGRGIGLTTLSRWRHGFEPRWDYLTLRCANQRRDPILLAVDQELGERARLRTAPEPADPLGALEVGEHEDAE
jgi:hypothetical protein